MYDLKFLESLEYFVKNDWFYKYVELISKNSFEKDIKFETQRHHIIPRHYFTQNGLEVDNSRKNIVILTFKDHMLAHLYLSGCTCGKNRYWNLYSIFMMTGRKIYDVETILNDIKQLEYYGQLYTEAIAAAPNHRKGTKISEETKQKMCDAKKGIVSPTKGRIWVNNGEKDFMINKSDVDNYLASGFVIGRVFRHSKEGKEKISEAGRNRIITDEFRRKMSEIASKQIHSEEQNRAHSIKMKEYHRNNPNPFSGKHHTEDSKKRNREAHVGKICINNGIKNKYIYKEELNKYIDLGYVKGSLRNKTK